MPQLLTTTLNGGIDPGIAGTGARASYAMLSYNTTNGTGGYALYDGNWCPPLSFGTADGANNSGASDIIQSAGGTFMNYNAMFQSTTSTLSTPSSSGTNNYMNATNNAGEFGNAMVDVFSDGTWKQNNRGSGTWQNKQFLNINAINSDHANKRHVYLLISGRIRAVDRLYGNYNYPEFGTSDFVVQNCDTNMNGSASYHATRKELTILSYTGSGTYNVITYANVDFNQYFDPFTALNRPEVTRTVAALTLGNWQVNNNESYYNLKPVVTDNGTVFVAVMFTSNRYSLYQFTRNGTNSINVAEQTTSISLTTSYGREQQGYPSYGQRQITSRDGTSVLTFCPYYYYGSGIDAYMIDKTGNTYTTYQYGDTSFGTIPVPFQNNGWQFIYAGNVYSGNWQGAYIMATFERSQTGGFTQTGSTQYFTKFTNPNTTNYPGYTQVVDYPLLTSNNFGVKLSR